jgi:tetraacyldisaccharide 4'-kinase
MENNLHFYYASIKKWYICFLQKNKKNFIELILYLLLYLLSLLYATIVYLRNFLYNSGALASTKVAAKVISVGNLSWGGSGKTTLAVYLYNKLSPAHKIAVLRRGYGSDEAKLMAEKGIKFYSSKNRVNLAKTLSDIEIFILDDGFQYRKLAYDINIVIMAAYELRGEIRLVPSGIFRERISSLCRADILVINHADEIKPFANIKNDIQKKFPHLKIYLAKYIPCKITDQNGNIIDAIFLKDRKIAALTAIGYPQGFFNKLKEMNLNPLKEIVYPDHYEFTKDEFIELQEALKKENILDIVISRKDKYHLPLPSAQLNIYTLDIKLEIED